MKKLPRGYFEFEDSEGKVIKGRVCVWSLNRFCTKMQIATMSEMYLAITTGISIQALAEIILCAVEYEYRGKEMPYTIDNALDWVDDMGGIAAAIEFIGSTMNVEDDGKKKEDEQRAA